MLLGSTASALAGCAVKEITCQLFDMPQDEALEQAYKFMELRKSCSNGDVNATYKSKVRKYHPDKGGDKEKFQELQICMEIVRAAREM